VGRLFAFQNLDCVVVRGRLYIVSIAREKIKENGYIKGGGVGFAKRKTAFSGLFGHFLRWRFLFCPWVGVYWAFGVLFCRCCVAGWNNEITCRTKLRKSFV
jgi:hypothetical protein